VPKRAKETFTNNLSTFILDNAIKETNSLGFKELADDIQSIKGTMETLSKKISLDKQEVLIEKKEFFNEIEKISSYEELQGSLAFAASQIMENKKRSFTQFIALFMESWLGPEEGFARILSRGFLKSGKPVITLSYKCLDPSIAMSELIRESHAMIFMSGTLTPLDMYADLLGTQKEKLMQIEYLNPFPQENRLNIIVPDTSTKYTQRNPKMYEAIAEKCSSITNIVPGNTIIFFPSYHVLNEVYNYFQKISEKTMLLEDPNHGKEQRSNLLERFKGFKDTGSVLLGVAGGSFAEGIDLPGDLLKCVIVVGLPLTKPNLETQEQITYYDKRFSKGWDYGYIIPALIKTLQSAGRCIRSETDRGVIVFMDERYTWQNYKKCFSSDMNIKIEKNPEYLIKQFFENHKPY
jgi:DNA excision repair protein ERCC-2